MSLSLDSRPVARRPADIADGLLGWSAQIYLRQAALFGVLVLTAYMAIVLAVSVLQPQLDWDALAYVALTAERSLTDPVSLHAYAYDVVRQNVEPATFLLLTEDGGGYRSQMYADPAGFVSMLGMYRVKWLYVELVTGLAQFMSPLAAIRLVSMASALVFAGVSLLWLRAERSLGLAAAFSGILIVSGFADIARAASPDMMFSALLLAGLLAHSRGREILTAVLLVLAFLVRPDNVIFLGAYAALLAIYRRWSWGVFGALLIAALAFVPLTTLTGQPGWWKQLYFASIEKAPNLDAFSPPFSPALYLVALVKQFLLAATAQTWIGTLLLAFAAVAASHLSGRWIDNKNRILVMGLFLGIAAKFVLVPIFDTRIYFAYLIAVFLALAGSVLPVPAKSSAPLER